ncbi:PAS domain-containing protein [Phaeovulum sp. W22_SRMD_FR3]|uniref:PAS domain-containing protein n=1 Tax=Phaeovulum sp. W22_SRMD_FR3 TaxID=3240274 RepID=UPI003F9AFAC2
MEHERDGLGEVVSMAGFERAAQNRVVEEVRAYWEGLRRGRPVPSRAEVDPRGIERALEFAFILERVAPGMARFRLAGMHLNDLMGMEVRGMPLTAFFAPAGRKQVAEVLESMFQEPAIAELTLTAEGGIGKPALTARLLILPLKSDLGDVTRALGCLVSDGEIGRSPRRFEVTHVHLTPVQAGVTAPAASLPQPIRPEVAAQPAPAKRHIPGLDLLRPALRTVTGAPAQPAPAQPTQTLDGRPLPASPEERRAMMRLVKTDS